jgi:hypothetical protein
MVNIRRAESREREVLRQLQFRASTVEDAYRELLLANPDAIDIPLEHCNATTATRNSTACSSTRVHGEPASERFSFAKLNAALSPRARHCCMSPRTRAPKRSILPAASRSTQRSRHASAPHAR